MFGWFSVVFWFWGFFGYKGLEANLSSGAMGNAQLGTHWTVRNCLTTSLMMAV